MKKFLAKDGSIVVIRKPVEEDAEDIILYSKILFASTDQVLTMPEEYQITVDEERAWINRSLQDPSALTLVAEIHKKIVGLLFFVASTKLKNKHTGEYGVSVHPEYQNLGIGKSLVRYLLDWAQAHEQIEKVSLHVFESNSKAIALYTNLGFIEEGRHVKAVKQPSGEYVDVIQMYIET